jgi:two-component system, NtrC family, response regulator AtoC
MKLLSLAEPDRYPGMEMSKHVEQLDPEAFFVSASPVMQKLRAQAELLAQADVPVFIVGEIGSGKDAVARLIHKLSVRSGFKFLKLNCAVMPSNVLESELFGTEKVFGSGTGETSGTLELAEHGTIYLDEIAEMPTELQARLLQELQKKELHGGNRDDGSPTGVRILAATSSDLERALADQKLRDDLYYRLSAFTVRVPPLRQRRQEISLLLRYSMHRLAKHYGLSAREFPAAMLDVCQWYPWPGNLRELEAFVKRYLVSGDQALIPGESDLEQSRETFNSSHRTVWPATPWIPKNSADADMTPKSLKSFIQGIKCEAEKNAIGVALEKTGWNRKAAARLLKVSYRTLLYKIEYYKMNASLHPVSTSSIVRLSAHDKESGKIS